MAERALRILCLGYCFPPVASPESFVTAKTMAAIPNTTVDVVTTSHELHLQAPDHSLDTYVAERFGRIERIDGWIARLLGKIARLPIRPDRYLTITGKTVAEAQSLDPAGYDAIVTRSQYHSVHAAGLRLKRRHPNTPWIACFSDPWSGSVFEREVPLMSGWSRRLERKVLETADALVFPTIEMRKHVATQQPEIRVDARSHIIPHGFDPALSTSNPVPSVSQTVRLAMFGSFYGPRSPQFLVDAIGRVADQPDTPEFVVDIFGRNSPDLVDCLKRNPSAAARITHKGSLPHAKALQEMASYDVLITVDAPTPEPSIFLSSKVVDYLGTARPIFAVTPKGATADLVDRAGGRSVHPDNTDSVASALSATIRDASARRIKMDIGVTGEYRIENVGRQFRDVLDSLVERA